jgi:hypothetical protein
MDAGTPYFTAYMIQHDELTIPPGDYEFQVDQYVVDGTHFAREPTWNVVAHGPSREAAMDRLCRTLEVLATTRPLVVAIRAILRGQTPDGA